MAKTVADLLCEKLANDRVKRCYGIEVQREYPTKMQREFAIPEMSRKA